MMTAGFISCTRSALLQECADMFEVLVGLEPPPTYPFVIGASPTKLSHACVEQVHTRLVVLYRS